MIETKTMKTIIRALRSIGIIAIVFSTGYFVVLYTDFTQLILSLGIAGFLILAALIYIYNWMQKKDEELEEMNKSIDLTRDYMRDLEQRYA